MIAEAPLLIVPKPEVIEPEFIAPVVTIPEPPAIGLYSEPSAVPFRVIASASNVPSTSTSPDMSKDPNEPTPVVVIAEAPLSIVPKPDVIDPEFNAPVVTILLEPATGLNTEAIAVPPIVIASASRVPSTSISTASTLPLNTVAVTVPVLGL